MMQISKLDSMYVTYNLFTKPMYAWRYQSKFKTNLKVHYSNMKDCKNENSQSCTVRRKQGKYKLFVGTYVDRDFCQQPTIKKKSKDEISSSCPKFVCLLVDAQCYSVYQGIFVVGCEQNPLILQIIRTSPISFPQCVFCLFLH